MCHAIYFSMYAQGIHCLYAHLINLKHDLTILNNYRILIAVDLLLKYTAGHIFAYFC